MDSIKSDNVQTRAKIFSDKSSRLQKFLFETKNLIHSVRTFSSTRYPVHYPINNINSRYPLQASSKTYLSNCDNSNELQVASSSNSISTTLNGRTSSNANYDSDSDYYDEDLSSSSFLENLNILKVDARLFNNKSSDIVSSLENSSISRLLEECLLNSESHIDKLIYRVADSSSKILVTGDLNAGKTTFINSLLRRQVLPIDQQPCTMVFCEVLDASNNGDNEEIHGIVDTLKYNIKDPSTYCLIAQQDLEDTVFENKPMYQQLKIYVKDNSDSASNLLHNGAVDISFIDSPGLNRDSIKTTQLFARQEEIDVVVFVVNAENHFTLSGQEFLASAGKEKAHIFIVVNRFDAIRKKDRCKSMIMEQICQLSPETYNEASNLVHFISAKNIFSKDSDTLDFEIMEKSLRWWTLEQRFKSKLAPAQRYILNVLGDLQIIAAENTAIALTSIREINDALRTSTPRYELLLERRAIATKHSESLIDEASNKVQEYSEEHLHTTISNLESTAFNVSYSGIFSSWDYAEQILITMVDHIRHELFECIKFSKSIVSSTSSKLVQLDTEREQIEGGSLKENHSIKPLSPSVEDKEAFSDPINYINYIMDDLSTININFSDFIDINWEKLQVSGSLLVSASSIFVYTKASNLSNLINLVNFSSNLSPRVLANSLVAVAGLLSFGSVFYLLNNTDATIRRKLATRIKNKMVSKKHISTGVRYFVTASNRAIRPFVWQFQTNFQRMLEAEERKRADHLRSRQLSQEAQMFFDELRAKISDISRNVRSISSDDYFK
ncbi:hypothetical protein BB561_002162 [Smittium simulii]|uniref:Dynamin-type G domain-containing protein n=1 Tax=Smittium simulii TaxID=133385 RepID=A0A2T9YRF6_9FUNG|nr:hypothetical protein BB561_002162 [Smittium simulii]